MRTPPVRGFGLILPLIGLALIGAAVIASKGDVSHMLAAVATRFDNPTSEVDANDFIPRTTTTSTDTGDTGTSVREASLTVSAPNGGETLYSSNSTTIQWRAVGQTNPTSIALYKNEVFVTSINSNVQLEKSSSDTYSYSWTPKDSLAGSGYKIVVSAPKAVGGTLSDKSDGTFSIIAQDTSRPVCGLYRGGTDAKYLIASPNPPSSVENTDAACIAYCDASGPKAGDICIRGTNKIKVYEKLSPYPDLVASSVIPNTQKDIVVGSPVPLSTTVRNQGGAPAGVSNVQFQSATNATGSGAKVIGYGKVGKLVSGGAAEAILSYAFPQASSPTRYVRACADIGLLGGSVKESNEQNNCGAWSPIYVSTTSTTITVGNHDTSAVLTYVSSPRTSSYGTFTIKFDVTAVYGNAYIPRTIDTSTISAGHTPLATPGVTINANMGATSTGATITKVLTTTADVANATYYVVHEGDTETFIATVVINPNGTASSTANYQIGLDKVRFSKMNTSTSTLQTVDVDEWATGFHTDPINIPG